MYRKIIITLRAQKQLFLVNISSLYPTNNFSPKIVWIIKCNITFQNIFLFRCGCIVSLFLCVFTDDYGQFVLIFGKLVQPLLQIEQNLHLLHEMFRKGSKKKDA